MSSRSSKIIQLALGVVNKEPEEQKQKKTKGRRCIVDDNTMQDVQIINEAAGSPAKCIELSKENTVTDPEISTMLVELQTDDGKS